MKTLANFRGLIRLGVMLTCATLITGCLQANIAQQEQLAALESERKAIDKKRSRLREQHQELDTKLALLETEKQMLNTSRVELDQQRRKMEVLKKSVQQSTSSDHHTNSNEKSPEVSSLVIGQLEKVIMTPPGLLLTARIDTGAETSSLNALDMTEFERDGKPYVKFNIIDPQTGNPIQLIRQVRKHKKIKDHGSQSQLRPVIKMRAILGSIDQRIYFTLVDRSNFKHQVLIGRNFLRDFAIVDVSKKFVTTPASN